MAKHIVSRHNHSHRHFNIKTPTTEHKPTPRPFIITDNVLIIVKKSNLSFQKPVKTTYKECCTGYIQDKTNVKT